MTARSKALIAAALLPFAWRIAEPFFQENQLCPPLHCLDFRPTTAGLIHKGED
jgi:hypothetical protein